MNTMQPQRHAGVWSAYNPSAAGGSVPVEVYVRDVNLTFIPTGLGSIRFKPYVGVMSTAHNYRWMTPRLPKWRKGPMRFASIFSMPATLGSDVIRIELWHHRRFRRDLLLATATLPLEELSFASSGGYAMDRWLPLVMAPGNTFKSRTVNSSQVPVAAGPAQVIGLIHLLARIETPVPAIASTTADAGQQITHHQQTTTTVVSSSNPMGGAGLGAAPMMGGGGGSGMMLGGGGMMPQQQVGMMPSGAMPMQQMGSDPNTQGMMTGTGVSNMPPPMLTGSNPALGGSKAGMFANAGTGLPVGTMNMSDGDAAAASSLNAPLLHAGQGAHIPM